MFLAPMHRYLHQRLAHKNAASTYVYLLTHQASVSFSTVFLGDPEKLYGMLEIGEFFNANNLIWFL